MTITPVITLTHYELGAMQVRVWDEASWQERKRIWSCDGEPELGSFEDDDFEERREVIDQRLRDAHDLLHRAAPGGAPALDHRSQAEPGADCGDRTADRADSTGRARP